MSDWEKIGISDIWTIAKCGNGYHFRIPTKIVESLELESGDEVHIDLKTVKRKDLKT